MVIDLDRCTGCGACVIACQMENNQPVQTDEETRKGRLIQWVHILTSTDPNSGRITHMPIPCQHCDNPPCTRVCPVNATYRNPEGIVAQIYARCIGCRYCVNACPYTCKFFNWREPEFPKELKPHLNPDVSLRPKGVTEKCTFCHHRLQHARERVKAEGRELKEGDFVPACVEACPAQAMYFGDLDDPNSTVSKLAGSPRAFRLQEELGTRPKVIYLKEG